MNEVKEVPLTCKVDTDTHKLFKVICALEGTSVKDKLASLVNSEVGKFRDRQKVLIAEETAKSIAKQ